ncbi:gluconate 2-dehydrogenase subunit 3 family protein [Carnimonas nigrificans]|uniref:gluconate 2-dehydrogenase subunit 3 family protein n=1 Tax=Carnimonas nigrificans TaxID=64323 RepID=UPI000471DC20|nr:gluconate 2-dehydrogenase subunit 3 family protein [Carnimonas nigrificans]
MSNDSGARTGVTRRQVLATSAATAFVAAASSKASALTFTQLPEWSPFAHNPPPTAPPGDHWQFFTADEAATIEAIVDRLIPADDLSIGGKEAGCAVFIDRQLQGFFGTFARLYMEPPFGKGTPAQGDQSPLVPQQRYRFGLAELEQYCQSEHQASFKELNGDQQDQILSALEQGEIHFEKYPSADFFALVLQNTKEGFFADPVYGGNKDMVSWKMIGFPGARYDYRDYVEKHNQTLDLEPLSIGGGTHWNHQG